MAQLTIPLAAIRTVAARTRYDPHAMCGTKRRTSIRKESSARIKVSMLRIKTPRRYRGEWEGAWRWAVPARTSMMSVKRHATGWTMRMAESVVRVPTGRSKLAVSSDVKRLAIIEQLVNRFLQSFMFQQRSQAISNPVLSPDPPVSATVG